MKRPDPYAPPQEPPPKPLVAGETTRGARIAGWLFMFNGLLVLVDNLMTMKTTPDNPTSIVLPTIIDFAIGASLASNKDKYRTWAIVRVALGALFFSVLAIGRANYWLIPFQLVLSASFLSLLIGDAPKMRIVFGCVGFGLYAVLEIGALAFL